MLAKALSTAQDQIPRNRNQKFFLRVYGAELLLGRCAHKGRNAETWLGGMEEKGRRE